MQMTDVELLQSYRGGSEQAFADLVRRHLGWVYGLARRRLSDAQLAEDVSQAVFVLLHRKAPRFDSDRALVSWMHRTVWYAAAVAARTERRRRRLETEVAIMHRDAQSTDSVARLEWQELAPLLDDLVARLSRTDREAILLRYYRGMSHAEVASQLGTSEEAARKRVDRAVERLRAIAAQRGVEISASALVLHLGGSIQLTPPAGLIATATTVATSSSGSALALSSGSIVKGATIIMATKQLLIGAGVVAAVLLVGGGAAWIATSASAPAETPPQTAAGSSSPVKTSDKAANLAERSFVVVRSSGSLYATARAYPHLSPYSAIRWRDTNLGPVPEVQIKDNWYELREINAVPVRQIIQFAQSTYNSASDQTNQIWRKRFEEDLPELMTRMGKPPADTVSLAVSSLDPNNQYTRLFEGVPMTAENRQQIIRSHQQP